MEPEPQAHKLKFRGKEANCPDALPQGLNKVYMVPSLSYAYITLSVEEVDDDG